MTGTNPVGTWQDTNYSAMSGTAYPAAVDANFAVAKRIVDRYAPRPQATPNMTVLVDAGHLFLGGSNTVENIAQTTSTFSAPSSGNSRKDWIVGDAATGTISVVTGTQASSPTEPNVPAGKFPIAIVTLASSTTAITQNEIADRRNLPAATTVTPATSPAIIASGSFSGVGSGIIPLPSGYAIYEITVFQINVASGSATQVDGVWQDSVSGDIATANQWSYIDTESNTSSSSTQHNNSDTSFQLMHAIQSSFPGNAFLRVTTNQTSVLSIFANYSSVWVDGSSQTWNALGSCKASAANALSGLKIRAATGAGNISFAYRVVGIP